MSVRRDRDVIAAWAASPDGRALFLSGLRADGECRIWTKHAKRGTYPIWNIGGRPFSARRIMWELLGKELPDDMDLVNTCGNLLCVAHTVVAPNALAAQTHCLRGHPLTEDNLVASVTTERRCLVCHRMHSRKAVARYRARKLAAKA
ncbi:hypothetical protein GCM10010327_19770 [Streptomyces nitrosporeus]|nr:hypothetical protein GCM10010327_19770 [Streptomyces nitrosporeus]